MEEIPRIEATEKKGDETHRQGQGDCEAASYLRRTLPS